MLFFLNKSIACVACATLTIFLFFTSISAATTLEKVQKNDVLRCGFSAEVPGFSSLDTAGNWRGFDVDVCKAVAAAVLGDAAKVEYIYQSEANGFIDLQTGKIDIFLTGSGLTLNIDTALGLRFVTATFFGDLGFMVPQAMESKDLLEREEVKVCMQDKVVLRNNLTRYFNNNNQSKKITPIVFNGIGQAVKAFDNGRCDMLFGMKAYLHGLRSYLSDPERVALLPEVVAGEVHGPIVRQDDYGWFSIVRWTVFALLKAEEYGITSENIDQLTVDTEHGVEELLGGHGNSGLGLGLEKDWMYQTIKQVGNYKEIFDRNIGKKSSLKFERGANKLWQEGGALYAPALQ